MYDIVVVGGGPAGLTAAVYGRRNGKTVLVIEKSVFGGQIVNSPKVENIPGFAVTSGEDFADKFLEQVIEQGAEVILEEVVSVSRADGISSGSVVSSSDIFDGFGENEKLFRIETAEGGSYEARSMILATGTKHRLLGLPGEEDLIGNGISFCAVCDGDFYKDKTVVMIGGGNSAFVESNLLSGIVKKLIMLQDLPYFTAEQKSQDQLFANDNVEAHVETKILGYEVTGGALTGVRYEEGGVEKTVKCDGVFLAIGLIPDTDIFKELVKVNEAGYFDADEKCKTSLEGVFVAGDCRTKTLRQVVTACSDGAQAAIAACEYLSE